MAASAGRWLHLRWWPSPGAGEGRNLQGRGMVSAWNYICICIGYEKIYIYVCVCIYIYIMKLWMCFLVGLHGFGACTSLQMLTSWWFQMWQKWNFIRPNSGFFPIPSPSLVMHHLFVCKLSYAVAIVFSLTTEKHTVSLCCLRSACCSYSLRPQFLPIQPRLDGCEILHHRKDGWNPQKKMG